MELKRPSVTKEIAVAVAEKLIEKHKIFSEYDIVAEDLGEAIFDCRWCYYDGFKIVKEAEDCCGIDGSEEFVDMLSGVSFMIESEIKIKVKEWMAEHNIQPRFKIGDSVKFKNFKGIHIGQIYKIEMDNAKYYVHCDEIHGVSKNSGITHGQIISFEDAGSVDDDSLTGIIYGNDLFNGEGIRNES